MNIKPVADFDAPELDIYARLSEVQLLRYHEPEPGLFIAESPNVIRRALDAGYEPVSFLMEERYLADGTAAELLARCPEIPVCVSDQKTLSRLVGYCLTRGLLCAMRRRALPPVEVVCAGARRIAVLENVVNPTNVGAVFRSAAALDMDAVLLTSACCDPLYRRAVRVSMGTVFQIPWTMFDKRFSWPEEGPAFLRKLGFATVALALSDAAVPIDDARLAKEERLAVVLGTEGDGLAPATIAGCDYTARIPMSHGVDSLNVAAAGAVAFWQLGRRPQGGV